MSTLGILSRAGAALAAGGLVLGLSAIPAGSQEAPDTVTLTGSVDCQIIDGDAYWVVGYNLHNNIEPEEQVESVPLAFGDVTIDSAVVSANGDELGPVAFDPNPVPAGGDATSGGPVPVSIVGTGTFTLTLDWTAESVEDSGTETLDLTLDGSCVVPVTTSTSSAPAVEAVAVTPAFTG